MVTRAFQASAVLSLLLVAGCQGSSIWESKEFDSDRALVTSADLRLVNKTKPKRVMGGRVIPEHITCSEPSPDVAKAVAESFNLGGTFGGGLPSGVSPEAAAAISLARAEGMAQLTQRLGTIQLLRDGLFRACEAYANGAISETTYAVILSRFDDTMVTMLMGELAAGNFSGRMAALGTGAGGSASAQMSQAVRQLIEASGQLTQAAEPQPASGEGEETPEARRSSEQSRDSALRAAANSMAEAAQLIAAESQGFRQNPKIAETIGTMQRKYIENINLDAMVLACINAMDHGRLEGDLTANINRFENALKKFKEQPNSAEREIALRDAVLTYSDKVIDSADTPLAAHCLNSVLPLIAQFNHERLMHILKQSHIETEAATDLVTAKTSKIFEYMEAVEKRKLDLENLPAARQALMEQIKSATEVAKTARVDARSKRALFDEADKKARELEAAFRQADIAATIAEENRNNRTATHEAANKLAQDARARARQADEALAAAPGRVDLKEAAKREDEIAREREQERDTAKAELDHATNEANGLRDEADKLKGKAETARDEANRLSDELSRLEREANDKAADLDELTAQL